MNDIAAADRPGLATLTHVMYGLHAFSAVSGLLGTSKNLLRVPMAALGGTRCLAYLLDGSRSLRSVRYALGPLATVFRGALLSPAFVVTAFLTGWPSLIAVLLNLVKRGEVRGSWLESHFRWQLRTFRYALLWVGLALLFGLTLIGIPVAVAIALVAGLWVLYRLIRGWLRLNERQPMPF